MKDSIKLKSIKIVRDYAIKKTIKISFSNEQVTVVFGDNGCGKTTLLRTINGVFSQNENILNQEKVISVEIEYIHNGEKKKLSVVREEKEEMIEDENGDKLTQVTLVYNWDEFLKSQLTNVSSILFGVNRGTTNSVGISIEELYNSIIRTNYSNKFSSRGELMNFCVNLKDNISFSQRVRSGRRISNSLDLGEKVLTIDSVSIEVIENLLVDRYRRAKELNTRKVQKALFDTLSKVAFGRIDSEKISDEQYAECVLKNRERLIDALLAGEKNSLSDMIISQLNQEVDIDKEITTNDTLKLLVINMSSELDRESVFLQALNTLMKVFNEFIGPEKYLEITERSARIKFHSNKKMSHDLSELSSGEKHLLVLLTIFVIEGGKRSIFMVDEPEISLNILWQRRLVSVIKQLAPEAQLIFASHSPSIAAENSKYLVELK